MSIISADFIAVVPTAQDEGGRTSTSVSTQDTTLQAPTSASRTDPPSVPFASAGRMSIIFGISRSLLWQRAHTRRLLFGMVGIVGSHQGLSDLRTPFD